MRTSLFLIILLAISTISTQATDIYSGAGSDGFSFLKIGLGARAGAMGEAYVAAVDDATAPLWNPAGLTDVSGQDILFIHNEWIQAAKGADTPATCNFDYSGPMTETVLLANTAYRAGGGFDWDSRNLKTGTNSKAQALIREEYRKGWEI